VSERKKAEYLPRSAGDDEGEVYRFNANPEVSKRGALFAHPSSVLAPESTLGLLLSIALSSAQAVVIIVRSSYYAIRLCANRKKFS